MPTKPPAAEPLRIVSLTVENIKRLVAVHIEPDGSLIQITGRNGQGKSSVLDSIWWTLSGKGSIQEQPVRKGQTTGFSELDLGRFIVRRDYQVDADDGTWTTSLTVTSPDGQLYSSPQRLLDGFLGSLSFDPLAFMEKDAKGKVAELIRIANIDLDFDKIARENLADFTRRTEINRQVKALTERVATFAADVPKKGAPVDDVDTSSLLRDMEQASETNAMIERERIRREGRKLEAANMVERSMRLSDEAEAMRKRAAELDEESARMKQAAAAIDDEIAKAPALATPTDVADIRAKVEAAQAENESRRKVRDIVAKHAAAVADLKKAKDESDTLTDRIDGRNKQKADAIAAAKMPVEGLSFDDGVVTYNGIPLDQASTAEQIRVSLAIGMSMDPTLRVILIRQGSLLDDESVAIVAKWADEHGFQVWMERVDSSGQVGIVLEAGKVKDA